MIVGNYSCVSIVTGAFIPGVPVQPMLLKYKNKFVSCMVYSTFFV